MALPTATPRNNHVWVDVRAVREELIFGQRQEYATPYRLVTSVLKSSDLAQYYSIKDQHGNILPANDPISAILFPAHAWMSDSGEERCMMLAAAKLARGDVLVGGLGLGLYPQFALTLERPVTSITIVEREPQIIQLMKQAWLQRHPAHAERITVVEGTIEDYLSEVDRKFDTVYLDTWEDADPRFLSHINYLLALADKRCSDQGSIQCWGYAKMVETFTEDMVTLTKQDFPWYKFQLDPVLQAYVNWLETQQGEFSDSTIREAAVTCALTTARSLETYERTRCFTAFGTSWADIHRNMALSKKAGPVGT